jgi:hypothetical protein
MFLQGMNIQQIINNCSFIQLPHFNYDLINKLPEEPKLRRFIKYSKEDKIKYLKELKSFNDEQINDIIIASENFPIYKIQYKKYVEGFENEDFVVGDLGTIEINITKLNYDENKNKMLGILHSNFYPGLFNECIQILVYNMDTFIQQDKIEINKKTVTYKFRINLNQEGTLPLKFTIMSTCFFGLDERINIEIPVIKNSEKRNNLLKEIDKRHVKVELSYFQSILKEAGMYVDDDEEEEEENNEEKEEKIQTNNEQTKNEQPDKSKTKIVKEQQENKEKDKYEEQHEVDEEEQEEEYKEEDQEQEKKEQ